MKKSIPWALGIFFILIGVANFANSVVAGLLAVIAGLLFLPPVIKVLASKKQLTFLSTNSWSSKVIATALIVVSIVLASNAQNEKLVASFNADPAKVISEAKQALEKKDFALAKSRIENYIKVLPNNPELKTLMAQIDSEKAEANKQAELNKQQANTNVTTPNSDLSGASDPEPVGRCLGFLSAVLVKEGRGKWTPGNNSYVQSNKPPMSTIAKIDNETKSCPTKYENISPCITGYSDYEKKLYVAYLSGQQAYARAKSESDQKVEILQLACVN